MSRAGTLGAPNVGTHNKHLQLIHSPTKQFRRSLNPELSFTHSFDRRYQTQAHGSD
jgi:hypothetical protein